MSRLPISLSDRDTGIRPWAGLLIGLGLTIAGCRSAPPAAPEPTALRWPPPPAPACIEYVRSLVAPGDLGVAPSLGQKMLNALTGGNRGCEPWGCPFGVWLGGGGALCFTDPERGEVVYADTARRELWRRDRIGGRALISPVGVASASGHVYVADSGLGRVLITDMQGRTGGEIDYAFKRPVAVAAKGGRLYVVDAQACCVQVFDSAGRWLQQIGTGGAGAGELNRPTHVAVDAAGSVYVTDALNSRVQVFDSAGRFVRSIGCHGDSSGHFGRPKGVAVDDEGRVFVVDGLFGVVQIFDRAGHLLLDLGEHGQESGQFWLPSGVAIGDGGMVVVADSYNRRLQVFRMLSAAPSGSPSGGRP